MVLSFPLLDPPSYASKLTSIFSGNRLANAHIIAVYHRICKLLFYHVKPIIVFDGKVPDIKRRTCAKRKALKNRATEVAMSQKDEKVKLSLQKLAVAHVMGKEVEPPQPIENRSTADKNDMFYLDPEKTDNLFQKFDSELEELQQVPLSQPLHLNYQSKKIDPFSKEFQSLPPHIQHELLIEHIDYIKERAKVLSYDQNTSSDSFSQSQIENVVAKNSLSTRLVELRKLLKENGGSQEQSGHTVQVFKTGQNSEIVFTKQINNTDYDILDTRRQRKVKKEVIVKKVDIPELVKEEPEPPKSDEMKNLFFGSDSEDDKVEVKDPESESDDDREVKNVLGLTRGHPGTFRNPYANKMKKTTVESSGLQLKMGNADYCDVSSSSESEFEGVQELEKPGIKSDLNGDSTVKAAPLLAINQVYSIDANDVVDLPPTTPKADSVDDQNLIASDYNPLEGTMNPVVGLETNPPLLQTKESIDNIQQSITTEVVNAPTKIIDVPDQMSIPETHTFLQDKAGESVSDESVPLKSVNDTDNLTNIHDINKSKNGDHEVVDLETLQEDINEELEAVKAKHRKAMSVGDTVNKGIVTDVKELLKIFGIPFLDAPGEAEAQCAELCNLGICDGVITDDSDIFLFGNVRVYKDVFKKDRDMRCFTSDEVKEGLGLNRRALIDIAQFVGSDYCTGVRGIGCVLALEIISKYQTLKEFVELPEVENKFKKFDLSSLPNIAAVDAYLHPKVNSSNEKFSWDEIDVCLIKDFLFKKLGWRGTKIDETLKPVLESLSSKTKQKSITNFFGLSQPKAPISKRVQNAVGGIRGGQPKPKTRKRKPAPKNSGKSKAKKTKFVCSEDSDSDF